MTKYLGPATYKEDRFVLVHYDWPVVSQHVARQNTIEITTGKAVHITVTSKQRGDSPISASRAGSQKPHFLQLGPNF